MATKLSSAWSGRHEEALKGPFLRTVVIILPRERERWYALWLLTQGWTAQATAEALERDPHTIGRWLAAFGEGGPTALIFEQSGGAPPPSKFTTRQWDNAPAHRGEAVREPADAQFL